MKRIAAPVGVEKATTVEGCIARSKRSNHGAADER
jgi:hypothetical protein